METLECSECGKPIFGRLDKRFCDAYCRNAFNNKVTRNDEQYIKQVNAAIRKNRRILKTLSPVGKSTVRQEVMTSMGFNFSLFSSMYRAPKGAIYYLSYEYGFTPIIDPKGIPKAVIINQQSYMEPWDPWKYVNRL